MKVLIVSATPEPASFVASMAKTSADVMLAKGHEVVHSDLYEMGWNPVASSEDFTERANPDYLVYALEQRNSVAKGALANDIQQELQKLQDCNLLILNFPIYWFSMPAILKGWFDRVMVSGLCYGGLRFYDNGGLQGKRVLVAPCIGGKEHMFGPDGIHGPLEQMLSPLLRGTLAYTGMDVIEPFIAWHVPYISPEARKEMMDSYAGYLRDLDNKPHLSFPKMSDFGPDLKPLPQSAAKGE